MILLIHDYKKVPQYIVKCKSKTDEEKIKDKEYHLKRLYELSLKSLGEIPQLEEPNEEQLSWSKNAIKRGWNKNG